jgi:pyruvate/2-oxoglutarate dehydrogenase complex dihydrolipoamide dehydrogenase (E3) component
MRNGPWSRAPRRPRPEPRRAAARGGRCYRRLRLNGSSSFDVAVIGGGTAGLTAALAARHEGARVVLVEREPRIGGDCTFYGCVPSKALIEVAQLVHDVRRAAVEGVFESAPALDFAAVQARRARVVEEIARDERDERFLDAGIEVVHAQARFTGPHELQVGERLLRAERVVIATGSETAPPPVDGLAGVPHLTNRTIFTLEHLPRRLLVLGGGATGLELAQAFRRFGSEVTVAEALPRLLPREEPEAGELAERVLREDGVDLRLGAPPRRAERRGREVVLRLADGEVTGDALLVSTGRRPATAGLGLERVGLGSGWLEIDARCRTRAGHVLAAGDVTGGLQFTHVAAHEGRIAGVNAAGKRTKTDYRVVPWVTFLDPEIARVGLTEAEARRQRKAVEVAFLPMSRVDRARILERPAGFVKLVVAARRLVGRLGGGELVGAQIVGPRAGELIQECALAMQTRAFAGRLTQTVHAYPSAATAVQQAAAQLFPLARALVEREP